MEEHFSTLALHGDDEFLNAIGDMAVAPAVSITTTFRYPQPTDAEPVPLDEVMDPYLAETDVYSRYTRPTMTRAEKVLAKLMNGHAMMYPSGLAATFAALMHLKPSTVAISGGYFGVHASIRLMQDLKPDLKMIALDDEYPEGTLCWVETPVNPFGEERDLQHYADKVHKVGGRLVVDSTFGPPPLQDPFAHGADIVMHSGTKYLGGHSDCLVGVLAVQSEKEWRELWHIRTYTGSTPGSMESWLLLRSLRTLEVRVARQAETANQLVQWFMAYIENAPKLGDEYDGTPGGVLAKVYHASLQEEKPAKQQMIAGPACFSILTTHPEYAKWLCGSVKLFTYATSLGGVESLIEQRYVSDGKSDKCLVRLSVGLEHIDDLKQDFRQAFAQVLKKSHKSSAPHVKGSHRT